MTVCPKCKFYNICKGRLNETVENCVRFKSAEQTNEEWFCQLSTEEKAECVTKNLSVYADDWVKRDEKLLNPATWVDWLNEVHK